MAYQILLKTLSNKHIKQTRKKLDHLVARMSSQDFQKQELSKIRRQWLAKNPLIPKQLNEVKVKRMRQRDKTQMNSPQILKRDACQERSKEGEEGSSETVKRKLR